MSKEQMEWSRMHDWYVARTQDGVIVCEVMQTLDGTVTRTLRQFSNFVTLREWAGY